MRESSSSWTAITIRRFLFVPRNRILARKHPLTSIRESNFSIDWKIIKRQKKKKKELSSCRWIVWQWRVFAIVKTCLDHRKYLWWANLAPFMPVLELIMRVIFSVHFAVAGSKGFFRLSLKNMLIGRKSRAFGTMWYIICGKIPQL